MHSDAQNRFHTRVIQQIDNQHECQQIEKTVVACQHDEDLQGGLHRRRPVPNFFEWAQNKEGAGNFDDKRHSDPQLQGQWVQLPEITGVGSGCDAKW
eukprot:CAMPEP_0179410978 /NCGR_PEP_ID=MMETSP0799-20121207/3635_1 /TAXON_ID=46947 /ORGANISM="Geminigera cryophila, Strain CCMP2564" /LENGTH=96 /DNA_ID=CAMNT_0021182983 /DNA_START=51 /DNA_END=344 /DNA_ORIENTATION=+